MQIQVQELVLHVLGLVMDLAVQDVLVVKVIVKEIVC